ncbi:alcohol dehydrogenase catalytic domain-containing protein, partial [Rubrivirga sp.]|uniref:alcohol dehydrogenase catalytic domain-containing protein n=1 Tax=Rubrivirga sp. TaxID=1885344 RepID=UPI003C712555
GRPAEVLALEDVPTPEPGPGQVRVRVRLTHRPIHPADLSMIRGTYGQSRPLPATGGNEGFGTIKAVGQGVSDLEVGDRVAKLGQAPTWQDSVVLEADETFRVPDALGDESAAQLFVNPLTAWLLLEAVDLEAGDVVVQTAGASAVARVAAEIALSRGVVPVSVVRSDENRDRLEGIGIRVIVADGNTKENRARLREVAADAAAVLDPVAG